MEHRWSTRIPLTTQVTLSQNMQPEVECVVKDIGHGGMFVETDPSIYSKNTTLTICFNLTTEEGVQRYKLLACVRHCGESGLGLMFLEHENDFSDQIHQLILTRVHARDHVRETRVQHSGRKRRGAAS